MDEPLVLLFLCRQTFLDMLIHMLLICYSLIFYFNISLFKIRSSFINRRFMSYAFKNQYVFSNIYLRSYFTLHYSFLFIYSNSFCFDLLFLQFLFLLFFFYFRILFFFFFFLFLIVAFV